MVRIWTSRYIGTDSDWRHGGSDGSGVNCPYIRKENLSDAEEYNAGGDCGAEGRWDCQADRVCDQGGFGI